MKTLLAWTFASLASFVAASANTAWAQTGGVGDAAKESAKGTREAVQEKKKKDFASQEKALQKLSTPGRSLVDTPIDKSAPPTDPVKRSGDKKKDFAEQEAEWQKSSTPGRALVNNPVDKNTPPAAPIKSLSKMTPEERAQLRKEVVKESKP